MCFVVRGLINHNLLELDTFKEVVFILRTVLILENYKFTDEYCNKLESVLLEVGSNEKNIAADLVEMDKVLKTSRWCPIG